MVWLKKIWGRTCSHSRSREKKSLHVSESLPVVQQQTHIRPISWSKPIRNSEGRTPPLIGRGPDIPVRVCKFENTCAAAVRQREGWVIEMRAVFCQLSDFVARFSAFSDPHSIFFFSKRRLVTNVATSWTNFSESLWSLVLPHYYHYCFSKFTCKYSRNHNTGIVLSCVYYLISSDNSSIKL